MTFEEFRANTLKIHDKRKHIIVNSHTTRSIWKWLRKNNWFDVKEKLTEKQFGDLIRGIHKIYVEKLLEGSDIKFPLRMGVLMLCKTKTKIKIKEGRLQTTRPINWIETLKLWHQDKEAKDKKILIRTECPELYIIRYTKSKARYKNKAFYEFRWHRDVKLKVSKKIINNDIDAYQI